MTPTSQEIEAGNKLLAEYGGWIYHKIHKSVDDDSCILQKGITICELKNLKYHTSMDWLYPVYCKVLENIRNNQELGSYNQEEELKEVFSKLPIEIFQATVKAVEWLNENKK